jgi:hypothetical protein
MFERYLAGFAEKLAHAPGSARLAEQAETTAAIPAPALAALSRGVAQLDPEAVLGTLALLEVVEDGADV